MQKIVVRHADGRFLKGYTQDFHPSRAQFALWPAINATPKERIVVPMSRLKAVFFVRDFDGNPGYRERKTFTTRGQGRRVEVTFADAEVMLGTTLNYRPDGHGFLRRPGRSRRQQQPHLRRREAPSGGSASCKLNALSNGAH